MSCHGGECRKRDYAGPVFFGIAFLVFLLARAPLHPVIEADSGSYIHASAVRTLGYPLFLRLVGVGGVLVVQPLLAAASLTYLGLETLLLCQSWLTALALMTAIAVNTHFDVYVYAVLTDSPFASLLMVILGLMMRYARHPSVRVAVILSLVAGLAVTVRPAGWFLLPLMVLVGLLARPQGRPGRRRRTALLLVALVGPLLAVNAAARGYADLRFGSRAGTVLPITMFGKAGMIDAPADGATDPATIALERDFAPIRALVARAPDFLTRRFLSVNYETCLEYGCSDALGLDNTSASAWKAAMRRIRANPLGYLRLTWREYRSMWDVYMASSSAEKTAIERFIHKNEPLPFQPQMAGVIAPIRIAPAARFLQPAILAIGVLTALLAALGLAALVFGRRLSSPLAFACLAALGAQGGLVLAALVGVGIPRYTLDLWPAMMAAVICGVWAVFASLSGRALSAPLVKTRGESMIRP